ncbi:MAG: hypothetical protein JWR35_986 [Marmoricola sp.]|nr:hypothetical protein [Marmoricola sp.]
MSRLIDATICPDCRSVLDERSTCTGCGLVLAGPLATQLWTTMVTADRLIERLRIPAGAPAPSDVLTPMPSSVSPVPARRRLPSASVPVVLLSLGALCLLIAAIVFVAVAWSSLGLGAKTTILLAVTALLAATATTLTRRDLRGSAEAVWLVVAGMLSVDLVAAQSAGLLGLDALSWREDSAMVGLALLAMGIGVGLWARTQPVKRLIGVQVVAVAGAILTTATNAWAGPDADGLDVAIAIPLLVAVALLTWRPLRVTAYGVGGVGAISWLVLLGTGMSRMDEAHSATWWSHLDGWPLLVATAYAAIPALLTRLPRPLRVLVATAALFAASMFAYGPPHGSTTVVLTISAILVALALVSRFAPSVWSPAAGILTAFGALGALLQVFGGSIVAVSDARQTQHGTLRYGLGTTLRGFDRAFEPPAPWTDVLVAVVAVVAIWGALMHLTGKSELRARSVTLGAAAGLVGTGVGTFVVEAQLALWLPVLALTLGGLASATAAIRFRDRQPALVAALAMAAYCLGLAITVASASFLMSAVLATVIAGLLAAGYRWLREGDVFTVGLTMFAVALTLSTAYAAVSWSSVIRFNDPDTQAITQAIVMSLIGVAASRIARDKRSRVGFELTSLLVGLLAVGAAIDGSEQAMIFTVVGTAICLVSITNEDRVHTGWLGAAVLGIATIIRLDVHVAAPELYTLPAALLLLGFGGRRLVSDHTTSSATVLGSGLTLGLLPSLLIALDEPVSLRGALIGAAGVIVLFVGISRRWSAPFVAGAATTGVLALRHLGPVVDGIPRWISLGTLGFVLLLVGITWEHRRRNVETAGRYLTALR